MTPKRCTITGWDGPLPEIGDFMQTPAGSTYLIIGQRPTRPGSKSLARLDLLKFAPDELSQVPADATIHQFRWNSRPKR